MTLVVLRVAAALGVASFAVTGSASAATLTWSTSAPAGLTDLQHQQAYTWQINGINIDATQITGATLKFNGFYNWTTAANDPYNVLFADLLDTSVYAGVKGATDNTYTGTLGNKYDIDDAFRGSPVTGGLGTNLTAVGAGLITAGTGVTYIGSSYNNKLVTDLTSTELANAGYVVGQTGHVQGSTANAGPFTTVTTTTPAVNWQLDFGTAAVNALKAYLAGADDQIAIGLDSDCHFYDSSISLEIYYNSPTGPAVPEPASLLLVGTGLAAVYRRRRAARTV